MKEDPILITCETCGAKCTQANQIKRFMRRHPGGCRKHAEKLAFTKQLAEDVRSVTHDHAIIKDEEQ